MPVFNNALAGAAGSGGGADAYLISKSLRLDEETQAHLHRTPFAEGNRQEWTISFWFKRITLTVSGEDKIWGASVSNNAYTQLYFDNNDRLVFNSSSGYMTTDMEFRDTTGWYHCVLAFKSTEGTDANKAKMYINGRLLTYPSEFSAAQLSGLGSNHNSQINTTNKHTFSGKQNLSNSHYFDGYIAEVNFVDGQQLSADSFGKYDDTSGEWVPKAYANSTETGVPITAAPTLSNGALIIKGVGNNTLSGTATSQGGNLNFWTSTDGSNWSHSGSGQGPNSIGGSSVKYVAMAGAGTSNRTWASTGPDFEYALWNTDTSFDASSGNPSDVTGLTYLSSPTSKFGTNGYHLDFSNSSNVGEDQSDRNNDWTTSNVNSGDIFPDSPTNDPDNAVGNYAILNTNDSPDDKAGTLSNGGLEFEGDAQHYSMLKSTIPYPSTGKWYFETTFLGSAYAPRAVGSQHSGIGFCKTHEPIAGTPTLADLSCWIADSGYGRTFSASRSDWHGSDIHNSAVVGVAVNRDANLAYFFVNGVLKQTINMGRHGYEDLCPFVWCYGNSYTTHRLNFGQKAFSHYPVHSDFVENASTNAGYNATKMFDGSYSTYMSAGGFNQTMYWKPYLKNVTSLRIYLATGSRSEQLIIRGNLGSQTYTLPANTSAGWQSFSLTNVGSNVNIVEFYRGGGGEYTDVYAVEINGTVLTDSGSSTGYKTLHTGNLTDTTIANPADAMNAQQYTGTAGNKSITTGFSPDLVWVKNMSQTRWHRLVDSLRGVTKNLFTNEDDAESTNDTNNYKSFDSTGFTLFGLDRDTNDGSGDQYVAWSWNMGDKYTSTANLQTETWSAATGALAAESFDGSTSTQGYMVNEQWYKIAGSLTVSSSMRIYLRKDEQYKMRINGGTEFNANTRDTSVSNNYDWAAISIPTGTHTNVEIRITGGGGYINAIEVDGKIMCDPGAVPSGSLNSVVYDRSQTWSNLITRSSSGWHHASNYFYEWLLDGNLNNYEHAAGNQTGTMTFDSTFPKGVIELFIGRGGGNNGQLTVNGVNISASDAPGHNWYRINGSTLSTISVTNPSQNVGIAAIRVNGKILADPSPSYSIKNFPSEATTVTSYPEAGMSISLYSGGNNYNQSFAHGLDGKTPEMVILKPRNVVDDWRVYHKGLDDQHPQNYYVKLQNTDAISVNQGRNLFDRVGPDPYVMHLGNDSAVNGNSRNFVAYSFASVPGFSKFGYYKKLGGYGPFINCGFRPAWVMIRRVDAANSWVIFDEARDPYNSTTRRLYADDTNVDHENTSHHIDIYSAGFKIRSVAGNLLNSTDSNAKYIWAAFASSPFSTARAR